MMVRYVLILLGGFPGVIPRTPVNREGKGRGGRERRLGKEMGIQRIKV
jgi:hypothetical protein